MHRKILGIAMLLASPLAFAADEFDITMDVVGADESFDEAIVNQIELPFAASKNGLGLDATALESSTLEQLEELVGGSLSGHNDVGGASDRSGGLEFDLEDIATDVDELLTIE